MKAVTRFHAQGQRAGMLWPYLNHTQAMRRALGTTLVYDSLYWAFIEGFGIGKQFCRNRDCANY